MCSTESFLHSTEVSTFTSVICARSLGFTRMVRKEFAASGASGICTPGQLESARNMIMGVSVPFDGTGENTAILGTPEDLHRRRRPYASLGPERECALRSEWR